LKPQTLEQPVAKALLGSVDVHRLSNDEMPFQVLVEDSRKVEQQAFCLWEEHHEASENHKWRFIGQS
jgi:hypothetical protein